MRRHPQSAETRPGGGADPRLLRRLLRAKDALDAASHEAWPAARLAAVAGVSPAHFARSFHAAFGAPPHRYLLTRRLERAKALLIESRASVTDIAFQTGWASLGSFSRTFRDVVGESPQHFRARCAPAPPAPDPTPPCYASAAARPDLKMAVLEKRRRAAAATTAASPEEI